MLNGLAGNDILVGGAGRRVDTATYADNFNTASLGNTNGTTNWDRMGGDRRRRWSRPRPDPYRQRQQRAALLGGTRRGLNGAQIQRTVNLAGATAATLSYDYDADGLDGGDIVTVLFSPDGVTFTTISTIDSN